MKLEGNLLRNLLIALTISFLSYFFLILLDAYLLYKNIVSSESISILILISLIAASFSGGIVISRTGSPKSIRLAYCTLLFLFIAMLFAVSADIKLHWNVIIKLMVAIFIGAFLACIFGNKSAVLGSNKRGKQKNYKKKRNK